MKKIHVGVALLFFVLFFSTNAISQQGKTQVSTNNHPLLSMLTLERMEQINAEIKAAEERPERVQKQAEQVDASAQRMLGYMYEYGKGVPQDYKKAVKWFRKAAEQGDMSA
jgi:predicted PurR-regulated permease PerM